MDFSLAESLGLSCPTIDIVDVGAMAVKSQPEYAAILARAPCRVVGFEPVQAECDKLNAVAGNDKIFLPYFIGDGSTRTFHLTRFSMTSSLYEPNATIVGLFNHLAELTEVVHTECVPTKRLDDIAEISNIDLLKIDIQGAERDAFRGATRLLKSSLAVWTEVEFVEIYSGQPLFGDVDEELRSHHLMLHRFLTLEGATYKPIVVFQDLPTGPRQHLWADVIYLRDPRTIDGLDAKKMLKLAVLAHDLLGSYDYAQLVLQHFDRATGESLWRSYMQRLTGMDPGNVPNPPDLLPKP
jgi:FkbM family methyltransferase